MANLLFDLTIGFTAVSISWILGYLVYLLLKRVDKLTIVTETILVKNRSFYKYLGVRLFKKIIISTPIELSATEIRIDSHSAEELDRVRNEMIKSEVSHFFGFLMCRLFACLYGLLTLDVGLFVVITAMNVATNPYPVLLQQMNRPIITRLWLRKTQNNRS